MRAIEINLLSYSYTKDEIGQEVKVVNRIPVPIIKQTSILLEEYYEANQQGIRPEIRIVISALNYNNETEFEYMGEKYTVIRTNTSNIDEIALIGSRRIGDLIDKDKA